MTGKLNKDIISVSTLLKKSNLAIPNYQRPYKWTQANLADLLGDLKIYRGKLAYRLGSIVFHQHSEKKQETLDIVDGQQRTLTLVLLVKALLDERLNTNDFNAQIKRQDVKTLLLSLEQPINNFLQRQTFNSDISHRNLHQNFMAAKRAVARSDFTEAGGRY
ncbi:conserved hypothetical protein [Pseudoalteromonas sp. 3J6]|uniref:DUF262 domain-containing protein n=1 Tax=Pseudoalteromonas sp. 3J6 TaxID=649161 RepID=UPI001770B835|nr:DUF262 domain-containing protein [Pseudoalteromonas sp. 3J6]CAD2224003.1 conserved hypothetical protein [Pseudoalteromonas sp. 3J6]